MKPKTKIDVRPLDQVAHHYVAYAVAAFRGNKTRAAEALEVDRSTVRRQLRRWEEEERRK
jgi:DNA-binding NtrC family response regulator